MVIPQPTTIKARDIQERFNRWADSRITDCNIPPLSPEHKLIMETKRQILQASKENLERILQEMGQ